MPNRSICIGNNYPWLRQLLETLAYEKRKRVFIYIIIYAQAVQLKDHVLVFQTANTHAQRERCRYPKGTYTDQVVLFVQAKRIGYRWNPLQVMLM